MHPVSLDPPAREMVPCVLASFFYSKVTFHTCHFFPIPWNSSFKIMGITLHYQRAHFQNSLPHRGFHVKALGCDMLVWYTECLCLFISPGQELILFYHIFAAICQLTASQPTQWWPSGSVTGRGSSSPISTTTPGCSLLPWLSIVPTWPVQSMWTGSSWTPRPAPMLPPYGASACSWLETVWWRPTRAKVTIPYVGPLAQPLPTVGGKESPRQP